MCLSIIAGGDKMKSCNRYGFEEFINSSPIVYILGYGIFFLVILYTLFVVGTMIVKLAML